MERSFVVQAVDVVVTRSRSLILDVTSLLASQTLGIPPASSEASTVGGILEELTLVAAAVGVLIPFTLRVVGASFVVSVAVRAAIQAFTSSRHGIPFAHGVKETVTFVEHGGASTLALVEIRIPRAVRISVAGRLRVVTETTLEFAHFVGLVDFADGVLHAIVLELLVSGVILTFNTNTVTSTFTSGSIPSTVKIFLAGSASGVAELARTHADDVERRVGHFGGFIHGVGPDAASIVVTSSAVGVLSADALADGSSEPSLPFTARVFTASVQRSLAFAALIALSSLPVPEAVGVGIASINSAVLLTTLLLALSLEPFASTSEGPAESGVGDEGARLGASVGGVGPHAVGVSRTFFLVEVHGSTVGSTFSTRPRAVISTLAGVFSGEVTAIADTLVDSGVPHTFRILGASGFVEPAVGTRDLATLARQVAVGVSAVSFRVAFTASRSTVAAAVSSTGRFRSHHRSTASSVGATDVAVTSEGVVPFTAVVGLTISLGVGEFTDLVAARSLVVPFAVVVIFAGFGVKITVRALLDAAIVTSWFAETVVQALGGSVETFASLSTDTIDGVPHATSFEVASKLGVEGVLALEFTDGGRVFSSTEVVLTLIISLTFLPRTVVVFALLETSVFIIIPLAAFVGIRDAFGLAAVELAGAVAVGGTLRVLRIAFTLPVAESSFESTFLVTEAFLALLVAASTSPVAVVISQTVRLHESRAALTAGSFELRIVFTHRIRFASSFVILVPAVLTTNIGG